MGRLPCDDERLADNGRTMNEREEPLSQWPSYSDKQKRVFAFVAGWIFGTLGCWLVATWLFFLGTIGSYVSFARTYKVRIDKMHHLYYLVLWMLLILACQFDGVLSCFLLMGMHISGVVRGQRLANAPLRQIGPYMLVILLCFYLRILTGVPARPDSHTGHSFFFLRLNRDLLVIWAYRIGIISMVIPITRLILWGDRRDKSRGITPIDDGVLTRWKGAERNELDSI